MGGYGVVNVIGGGYSAASATFSNAPPNKLLAERGAANPEYQKARDPRIKAAIAIGPWGMQGGFWDAEGLKGIRTPVMFVAGSADEMSGYEKGTRAIYQGAVNADRYLLTFINANHNAAAPIPAPAETYAYSEAQTRVSVHALRRCGVGHGAHEQHLRSLRDRVLRRCISRASRTSRRTSMSCRTARTRCMRSIATASRLPTHTYWKGFKRAHRRRPDPRARDAGALAMFIGHYALAFGAKRVAPMMSLGTLFLACQFADLLWPTLLVLGLEVVEIDPGNTVVTPLNFVSYPYSHSFVVLAGVVGAVRARLSRDSRLASGGDRARSRALVFSHYVLDVITHRPDLPITLSGSRRLGFGLWNYPGTTLALESALFIIGTTIYMSVTRARDRDRPHRLLRADRRRSSRSISPRCMARRRRTRPPSPSPGTCRGCS